MCDAKANKWAPGIDKLHSKILLKSEKHIRYKSPFITDFLTTNSSLNYQPAVSDDFLNRYKYTPSIIDSLFVSGLMEKQSSFCHYLSNSMPRLWHWLIKKALNVTLNHENKEATPAKPRNWNSLRVKDSTALSLSYQYPIGKIKNQDQAKSVSVLARKNKQRSPNQNHLVPYLRLGASC